MVLTASNWLGIAKFLLSSLVDQLYAKELYFCSFVTKSSQACISTHPNVFNSFCPTVTDGQSHVIFTSPHLSLTPLKTLTAFPYISL